MLIFGQEADINEWQVPEFTTRSTAEERVKDFPKNIKFDRIPTRKIFNTTSWSGALDLREVNLGINRNTDFGFVLTGHDYSFCTN